MLILIDHQTPHKMEILEVIIKDCLLGYNHKGRKEQTELMQYHKRMRT